MELEIVDVKMKDGVNVVFGQSHFIKTVEDVYEAVMNTVPGAKFGVAFCEASMERLVRSDGTDKELEELAIENAKRVGAGHSFFLFLGNMYPINVLGALKKVPEICTIYAATANPLQVIVASTEQGRGVMGVIDGSSPLGIETNEDKISRTEFLKQIGYKR